MLADDVLSRWERTRPGRAIVLAVVLVVGSVLVVDNLPNSRLKSNLTPVVRPVGQSLGLRQNWALFAPNPPRQQSSLLAKLEYSDGSQGSWQLPDWNGLWSSYTGYRWRKWTESVLASRRPSRLTEAARTIASFSPRKGLEVTRVTLYRIVKRVSDGDDRVIRRTRLTTTSMEDDR